MKKGRASEKKSKGRIFGGEGGRPKLVLLGPCRLAQDALAYFLESGKIVDVILNTDDVTSALDAVEKESPDVVVLDAEISPNSSTIVQDIVSTDGDTHVIIMAGSSHHIYVRDAVDAGASAYVEKSKVGTMELASVIREVPENNNSAFYVAMDRDSISDLSSSEHRSENQVISDKELEVMKYIAEGFSNKEIAKKANISEQTAKVHVHNIFTKLGARDRAQAVALCFRKKLIM